MSQVVEFAIKLSCDSERLILKHTYIDPDVSYLTIPWTEPGPCYNLPSCFTIIISHMDRLLQLVLYALKKLSHLSKHTKALLYGNYGILHS